MNFVMPWDREPGTGRVIVSSKKIINEDLWLYYRRAVARVWCASLILDIGPGHVLRYIGTVVFVLYFFST